MPRQSKILSARAVSELRWRITSVDKKGNPIPTWHPVGGATGLYLQCTKEGGKSWVYRYSSLAGDGKRIPMGLGTYTYKASKDSEATTTAQARLLAQHCAGLRSQGIDPRSERKRLESAAAAAASKAITFKQYAEKDFVPLRAKEYKGAAQVRRLKQLLRDYAYPIIGNLILEDIERHHVVAVLKQKSGGTTFYEDKHDAAKRTQNYIQQILKHTIAEGLRIKPNPAVWKDDLELTFPKSSKVHKVQNRPALNWRKLHGFVKAVTALDDPKGARPDVQCMMFLILTVSRSEEARHVDWDEIDVANKVWRVPGGKYKSENNWAIPLCKEAIKILKAQPSARHKEGRVFSRLDGGPLYSAALSEMPKALGFKADDGRYAVANGFRRTFRTWGQAMEFNNEAAELQMKHLNTNALKQVYIDDPEGWALFDRRKQIIDAYEKWAMKGDIGSDNVVDLSRRRKAS